MLRNFLHLWPAIRVVITTSQTKAFKKNKNLLLLTESELLFLEDCLSIFDVFVKATTKLQAEKLPTMYYLLPEIYKIYKKLEELKLVLNKVST